MTLFSFSIIVRRSKLRRNNGFGRDSRKFRIGLISSDRMCSDGARTHVLKHIATQLRHYSWWPEIQVYFFLLVMQYTFQHLIYILFVSIVFASIIRILLVVHFLLIFERKFWVEKVPEEMESIVGSYSYLRLKAFMMLDICRPG